VRVARWFTAGASPAGVAAGFRRALSAEQDRVLRLVGELADARGFEAFLVGGIVRDIALGYPVTDLDVVVHGDAERVARALASETGGAFKSMTEFGTCKVATPTVGVIDFATARSETYAQPGALPQTAASDMVHDLARRDFSLNAMALDLGRGEYGRLLDPCGGAPDLRAGKLRVMHDRSFIDDPTRVLRGVRFAARYGFTFERRTARLLRECLAAGGLATISGKRIYRELGLICGEATAREGLQLLERAGILGALVGGRAQAAKRLAIWRRLPGAIRELGGTHDGGGDLAGSGQAGADEAGAGWAGAGQAAADNARAHRAAMDNAGTGPCLDTALAWLATIFVGLGRKRARRLAGRFNLPKRAREACVWVSSDLDRAVRRLATLDRSEAYRTRLMLDDVPPEALILLYASCRKASRDLITAYLSEWRYVKPELTGGDIAALGVGQGPRVGRVLVALLRLKLEGKLADRAAEVAYVQRHGGRRANRR